MYRPIRTPNERSAPIHRVVLGVATAIFTLLCLARARPSAGGEVTSSEASPVRLAAGSDSVYSREFHVRVDTLPAVIAYRAAQSRELEARTDTLGAAIVYRAANSRPFEVRTDTLGAFVYRRVYGRELEVADVSLVNEVTEERLVFALRAPSPSPAKNGAVLRFEVPESVPVTLEMFDVAGRLVRTIANRQRFEPGRYGIAIRKGAFPPGLYLVRFRAGVFEQVQRLVIIG